MNAFKVIITVFHAVVAQTDSTPLITASGHHIEPGDRIIAISRDLRDSLDFGDEVWVICDCPYSGEYQVEDLMNKRFQKRIDILIGQDDPIGKWEGYLIKVE